MFTKCAVILGILALVQARPQDHHGATSYSSSTLFLGTVGHAVLAAPVVHHVAAIPVVEHHQAIPVVEHHYQTEQHEDNHVHVDYHAHPKYEFKYGVEDTHTHDHKSQEEHRDGDHTQGAYSVHEPDGTILTVHYDVTDKKSGFNAVVSRFGHAVHPQHYTTYSSHK